MYAIDLQLIQVKGILNKNVIFSNRGANSEIIHFQAGSILEARDNWDWTALFHAVNSGHHSVVDTLLRHKANPNSW